MIIKTKQELQKYQDIAKSSVEIMSVVKAAIAPGITTAELDDLAGKAMSSIDAEPAFKHVKGYKDEFGYNVCICINDVALHGRPSSRKLEVGDVIKLDLGIKKDGYYTDHCYTFSLGEPDNEDKRLIETTKLAVETAAQKAIVGNTTGDIGFTMQSIAKMGGFDVLKNYVGHGIGHSLHESPEVAAYGTPGYGTKLKEGMVITIEAQVFPGSDATYIAKNGWDVIMKDHKKVAMFEYMVVVAKNKPIVLTDNRSWETTIPV
jgi:methionyl aminopeptidase